MVGLDTRSLTGSSYAHAAKGVRVAAERASAPTRPRRTAAVAPSSAAPLTGSPSGCGPALAVQGFTPNQYQTAYGLAPLFASGLRGEGERVALIEIDGVRFTDLTSFASCFGLGVPPVRGFGVGLKHPLPPGGEATLDVEVLDAAAPGLKGIDVYETKPSASATLRALTAAAEQGLQAAGHLGLAGIVRARRVPRDRLEGSPLGRGVARNGRRQRYLLPGIER